jgi:hypothetical protein
VLGQMADHTLNGLFADRYVTALIEHPDLDF